MVCASQPRSENLSPGKLKAELAKRLTVKIGGPLTRYLLRRLVTYVITSYLAITFTFFFMRLIPGNPIQSYVQALLAQGQYTMAEQAKQIVDTYLEMFGLKGDLLTQYVSFMKRLLLHFDFGPSLIAFPRRAQELILERLPWTLGLLGTSVVISWLLGTILGALAGWKAGSKLDRALVAFALAFSQIPFYVLAVFLVLLFGYILGWLPTGGAYNPLLKPGLSLEFIASVVKHAILPSLSLVLSTAFSWLLSMRSLVVTILGEDYIAFAEAKGLRKITIFQKYVVRNALLPQLTNLGISLGFIVSGSVVVETLFRYPGVGMLFSAALTGLDYNLVMAFIVLTTLAVLTASFILDLIYPFVDPRVSYGE
jgi:peptide/nickel transport system permease protein